MSDDEFVFAPPQLASEGVESSAVLVAKEMQELAGRILAQKDEATRRKQELSLPETGLLAALEEIGIHPETQFDVAGYRLDFYFPEQRLCIEVDGKFHAGQIGQDETRTRKLREHGIVTFRVPAAAVLRSPRVAARGIQAQLRLLDKRSGR